MQMPAIRFQVSGVPILSVVGVCHYQPGNKGIDMYMKIAMAGLLALTIGACGGDDAAEATTPEAKDKTADVKAAKKSKAKKAKVKKAKAAKASSNSKAPSKSKK